MNISIGINANVILSNRITMSNCENFSNITGSTFGDISPHHNDSTPVSSDYYSERQSQSILSSKKYEASVVSTEEDTELRVENLERTLTNDQISKIEEILTKLECLNNTEKLLVQLKFPFCEKDDIDDVNNEISGQCEFGLGANQSEHNEALTWAISHLEEDQSTCLKKQEVYDDYKSFCLSHNFKYLSTADFGKIMKKAFPNIKARRLGARGQSKYCYSGLKNRNEIKSPMLIDVGLNCDKRDRFSDSVLLDKNSDMDSVSSISQPPDLSNIPEYDLSHNILVDAALVIIDFIKRIGVTKEVTSLKQAVGHILLTNQVETRTPHALRLLPLFQDLDTKKSKKKYSLDRSPLLRTIKKENLSNPNSAQPFQSAPIQHSLKRPKMSYAYPVLDKLSGYYENGKISTIHPLNSCQNFGLAVNNGFNYGINNNQHYYNSRMLNLPPNVSRHIQGQRAGISPVIGSSGLKPFIPDTFLTPIKDQPSNIISPILNSSLLERNPSTSKKLELSTSSKSDHETNIPSYQNMHQGGIVQDRSSKLAMYNFSLDYNYEPVLDIEINNSNQKGVPRSTYIDCEVDSPISMTARNYNSTPFDGVYVLESEKYEASTLPLKRHIRSDFQINFNPSPILNHFTVDSDYGNHDSISAGYRHHSSEENEYLDTPGNSPTNKGTYQDPSDHCSDHVTVKDSSTSANKADVKISYAEMLDFEPKEVFSISRSNGPPDEATHQQAYAGQMMEYPCQPLRGANDEFSVSSTTNICSAENDRHPSTTMLHSTAYK